MRGVVQEGRTFLHSRSLSMGRGEALVGPDYAQPIVEAGRACDGLRCKPSSCVNWKMAVRREGGVAVVEES